MSFPSADVVDGTMRMLQAWGIEAVIRDTRSDLEAHMQHRFDTHTKDELANMMVSACDELAATV